MFNKRVDGKKPSLQVSCGTIDMSTFPKLRDLKYPLRGSPELSDENLIRIKGSHYGKDSLPNFYDELIDFLCPNTRDSTPLLPPKSQHANGQMCFDIKLDSNDAKAIRIFNELRLLHPPFPLCYREYLSTNNQSQMKQTKFNNGTMIAVATPRGTTVAILAEDFTYEKPCMVECRSILRHDGVLTVMFGDKNCQLYIHQDCLEVRLANEQEGLRLFSAIKASGAEVATEKGEAKWKPADGDWFCIGDTSDTWVGCYKGINSEGDPEAYFTLNISKENRYFTDYVDCFGKEWKINKPTQDQIPIVDSYMSEHGIAWNATEKRVEKVLWRAGKGGCYYTCACDDSSDFLTYITRTCVERGGSLSKFEYNSGNYFQHESDCQLLCDQLNAVIKANKESRVKIN